MGGAAGMRRRASATPARLGERCRGGRLVGVVRVLEAAGACGHVALAPAT